MGVFPPLVESQGLCVFHLAGVFNRTSQRGSGKKCGNVCFWKVIGALKRQSKFFGKGFQRIESEFKILRRFRMNVEISYVLLLNTENSYFDAV